MFVNNIHANDWLLSRCFVPLCYLHPLLSFFTRETQVAEFSIFTSLYLGCRQRQRGMVNYCLHPARPFAAARRGAESTQQQDRLSPAYVPCTGVCFPAPSAALQVLPKGQSLGCDKVVRPAEKGSSALTYGMSYVGSLLGNPVCEQSPAFLPDNINNPCRWDWWW